MVLICGSLMDNDINIFSCVLALPIFFEKMFIQNTLPHLIAAVIAFKLLGCESSLYILDNSG